MDSACSWIQLADRACVILKVYLLRQQHPDNFGTCMMIYVRNFVHVCKLSLIFLLDAENRCMYMYKLCHHYIRNLPPTSGVPRGLSGPGVSTGPPGMAMGPSGMGPGPHGMAPGPPGMATWYGSRRDANAWAPISRRTNIATAEVKNRSRPHAQPRKCNHI